MNVFAETDIKNLLHDKRLAPPVASFYLNTDRATPEGEKYLASFRMLIHQGEALLRPLGERGEDARDRLEEAVREFLAFLDTEVAPHPTVRGVAVFISLAPPAKHDPRSPVFTAFTLPRPVRTQARMDHRPYIRPLLFLLDQYERVGVIVADRNHARIFTLFLGEIETIRRRVADTPRRHHQGGWKQMLFQRDVDNHVKAHIRATVREAVNIFGGSPLKRIIFGGSEETLAVLSAELPQHMQPLIAGTFLAETHASDTELAVKALALAAAAEGKEEAERVQELVDHLAHRPSFVRGPHHLAAVSGVRDTVRAVAERRARRVLLSRGLRAPGSVCDNCGALSLETRGVCPSCAFALRPVGDVLEHAVERAVEQDAEVEFVTEHPSLTAMGGAGALLRF